MRLNIRLLPRFGSVMLASMAGFVFVGCHTETASDATPPSKPATPTVAAPIDVNLAPIARVSAGGGQRGGNPDLAAPINNGIDPANSGDREHGTFGGRRGGRGNRGGTPPEGTQTLSVQYQWTKPISTKSVDVYWFIGGGGGGRGFGGPTQAPAEYRVKYWNGEEFVPVEEAAGLGVQPDKYNTTTFKEVTTERLRLECDYDATNGAPGILQWKVYDSGKTPNFPPMVTAGLDRDVMLGGKTYLSGVVKDEGKPKATTIAWAKESGPGDVKFENASAAATTATFSKS